MGGFGSRWIQLGMLLVVGSCTTTPSPIRGPMRVRSQHPAQLTVLNMVPTQIGLAPGETQLRWTNAYSSLFLAGTDNRGNSFEMDGENWRSAAGVRIGLDYGFEIDVEIPIGHTTGGFLDSFIVNWHDAFGFPNRGRDTFPKNQYITRARFRGQTAFDVAESDIELMDVPIELAWRFWEPTKDLPLRAAVRTAIELPTGNHRRGFGNGKVDAAIGVMGEYRWENFGVFAHFDHTFAATPGMAERAGMEFRDVTSGGLTGEMPIWDGWNAVVQVEWERSTLRDLGFSRAADDHWNLWTGMRVDVGDRTRLEVSLGEDLESFIGPDFTIWIALLHRVAGSK